MKKRGFLLAEETLKIILGVIAIGFLAFLLFSLYSHAKESKQSEYAKESLNFLISEISAGKSTVDVYNPEGWNLGVWPHEVKKESWISYFSSTTTDTPQTCRNLGWESCICICNNNDANSCDDTGICVNNPDGWDIANKNIELSNLPLTLNIDSDKKEISA